MAGDARTTGGGPRAVLGRREFLAAAAKTAAALPFWFSGGGCASLKGGEPDPDTGLCFRCLAGDVTSNSAIVWLRAEPGSRVSVRYAPGPAPERFEETAPRAVARDCDDTAKIKLEGLAPGTTYYYRARVAGKRPGPVGRFRTAPAPDDLAPVRFCFSGDSRESYQPFAIMDAIRETSPDFFLYLGDTIYADIGAVASTLQEFWAKYRNNRQDAPSQRLFREVATYVIWDDHEVANDCDPSHPLMPVGRKAFIDYWPIEPDPLDPHRLYRSFRWGKALELFILDVRQYRDRSRRTILGEAQKRWLLKGLEASTALFKFVATSVPFYGGGRDRWDGFPEERNELLRWIAGRKIQGVFFLAADLHYAAVSRIPGAPRAVKQIIAGPIASPINVLATGLGRRFEFFSNATFNYATVTVDPKIRPPQATVEFFDEERRSLYRTALTIA
ncbi:MAG TPA: alkaline phosphatase D family protein [candidate division Zixibacteria bacterium]|nr:alkaline phosphatase D family protein [candidate division Zixibacteria bacterium]